MHNLFIARVQAMQHGTKLSAKTARLPQITQLSEGAAAQHQGV